MYCITVLFEMCSFALWHGGMDLAAQVDIRQYCGTNGLKKPCALTRT